ncbi:MAG: radical SAM family heme chaperone HemW, partial [Muribaculaceae bacterium]|nr:radical SAM family heme chaperone HemW [Muribaculaceae bacterium]
MAGIYIHIPFCHSKCAYCDFYSLGAPVDGLMRRYAAAVVKELPMRIGELCGQDISTVYIGGGTPSAFPLPYLKRIIDALSASGIDVSTLEEFTIEANPEDLDEQWLCDVRSLGVNRVSMGVQSFDDGELASVSRRHSSGRAKEALRLLSESGVNYSADLIYGLPGQSLAGWKRNLETLLEYAPHHFSAYLLSYEPGTPLYGRLQKGEVVETPESLAAEMYATLCRMSRDSGYRHYEISAFCRPGYEARHNSSYWNFTPYLGLGCAAHSFSSGGLRSFNPPNLMAYLEHLEQGVSAAENDSESEKDRLNDYII